MGRQPADTAEDVRARAMALADYLLAVRNLIEKPARTLPRDRVYLEQDFPEHSVCVHPGRDGVSWLSVGRPGLSATPNPPETVKPYLVAAPTLVQAPVLVDDLDDMATEPGLVRREFGRWVSSVWEPWRATAAPADATRRLHDQLYDLRFTLDLESASIELVWGVGILEAEIEGKRVRYPLAVAPVSIEYDVDKTVVNVVPQGPPRLQTDPLSGLGDRRLADVLALAGPSGQLELDVWDADERHQFYDQVLRRLGFDPVIRSLHQSAPGVNHIHDSAVLFVRKRQRMVRRFLEHLRDDLRAQLSAGTGALSGILAHEPSRLVLPSDSPEAWRRVGERLLMPMPTNQAQESIAHRLSQHRNVAVQGPPGTGKTHTIRNLICHLVAHGKRVLVLAQKEDPLRVLRDGLPEEIQPLCLAVLGRSADQLVQLQLAARELSDRAATLDRRREQQHVQRLTADLEQAERDLAKAQAALRAVAEAEAQMYELNGQPVTPIEVGDWLRRNAVESVTVPDAIDPAKPAPLTSGEFGQLLALARRLDRADRREAIKELPLDSDLPSGREIRQRLVEYQAATVVVNDLATSGANLAAVRSLGREYVGRLAAELSHAAGELRECEDSWTARLAVLVRDPAWQQAWEHHVATCRQRLDAIVGWTTTLTGWRIDFASSVPQDSQRVLQQLADLRRRYAEGKKVNRLLNGHLFEFARSIAVNGEPVRSERDVDLAIAAVQRNQARQQLLAQWSEWAGRLGVQLPPGTEPELWVGHFLDQAHAAWMWERRTWPRIWETLSPVLPRLNRTVNAADLAQLAETVASLDNVYLADELSTEYANRSSTLRLASSEAGAAGVWQALASAWDARDDAAWDAAVGASRHLWQVRPEALEYEQLRARLAEVAPEWAATLDLGTVPDATGEDCLRAWQWRQAQTWFDRVVGETDTVEIGQQVVQQRERIRRLTKELTVASAWLEVSLSLDDRKKAALADWTAALRKIGKGTGKNAGRWQAAAQRSMAEAVDAVPVWVMTVDRALEQFKGGTSPFDVLIVDEASQADIFALPVLTLADRAVVVGDDQQIGPQLVGVPVDSVNSLIRTHLDGVPSAEHFDHESSLYDHAVRRSPERILLTEHFRCVPEIIQFSANEYYDGKIEPLRADHPEGIEHPVVAVYVSDGVRQTLTEFGDVNVAEAEALVEQVANLVAEPVYEGKTIGVISLLSTSGQAQYLLHRLRDRIGPDEMERRQLRVGDPYTFQGDERDVVLISMVVSEHDPAVGAFTGRDYHRRVNVAASRARDQMWVFHSIQPTRLRPDDARARLLVYCQNPREVQDTFRDLESRCDSGFEKAVLKRLLARDYRPEPQFRIGSYRIDFVLTAPNGKRLAIECDGDQYHGPDKWEEDIRRQAVLERVGNCVFVRIRGSVFHRDPDRAMESVWERIAELSIPTEQERASQPAKSRPASTRTVDVPRQREVGDLDAAAASESLRRQSVSALASVDSADIYSVPTEAAATESPAVERRPEPSPDGTASTEAVGSPPPPPAATPQSAQQLDLVKQLLAAGAQFTINPDGSISVNSLPPSPPPAAPVPETPSQPPAQLDATEVDEIEAPPRESSHAEAPRSIQQTAPPTVTASPHVPPVLRSPFDHSRPTEPKAHTVAVNRPTRPAARPSGAPAENDSAGRFVPVPPGYRSVGWIRRGEAQAAIEAYRAKRDVPIRDDGKLVGWARFYPSPHPEARNHRANVQITHASTSGAREVAWLKLPEVNALLTAAEKRREERVVDALGEVIGVVQFFSPTSEEARTFRSTTRLLRRRPLSEIDKEQKPERRW